MGGGIEAEKREEVVNEEGEKGRSRRGRGGGGGKREDRRRRRFITSIYKIPASWNVLPCQMVTSYRNVKEACTFHIQGLSVYLDLLFKNLI